MEKAPRSILGGGSLEWVWAAIASGDLSAVRAAPPCFDMGSVHPLYGSVLTAFLPALLGLEGRFLEGGGGDRARLMLDIVEELGNRGARPDAVIPSADIVVKGLYQDWRLRGDLTPMQAVIQMRNDLLRYKFTHPPPSAEDCDGASSDASVLSRLIDRYAALSAQAGSIRAERSLVPEAVVQTWERCWQDRSSADVDLVSPDGLSKAHSLVLCAASPVLAAMLSSSMLEGRARKIPVDSAVRVVDMLLFVMYTGCLPEEEPEEPPKVSEGLKVTVRSALASNSANSVLLPAGLCGEVHRVDDKGDALIKFDGIGARQWITRRNFSWLRAAAAAGAATLQRDLAGAFAVAHCWQMTGLAAVLAERLERGVTAEGLEPTLEAAVLHGASRLREVCLAFARSSGRVREAYDASAYCPCVLEALQDAFQREGRKRTRTGL